MSRFKPRCTLRARTITNYQKQLRRQRAPQRLKSDSNNRREDYADATSDFFAYFLLYFSTRPAESTNFCRPVKNGWQLEQISSRKSPMVERVSNVLPQTQDTVAFLYSGWIPGLIVATSFLSEELCIVV